MFSSGSRSSISLATVTPSLVMIGAPNFFSITALRPLGPSVIFTASARAFTPRRIAWREFSPVTICFAILVFPPEISVAYCGRADAALLQGAVLLARHFDPARCWSWTSNFDDLQFSGELSLRRRRYFLPAAFA